MESIVKVFSSVFLLLFLLLTGIGVTKMTMNTGRAERFASDAAVRISNSNYSEKVINNCKNDAKKLDYDLQVDLVYEKGTKRVEYGALTLNFYVEIPLINIRQRHSVEADIV